MYSDNITQNFKATPTVLTLLRHFASDSFSSALLEALEKHISDQGIVKQVCKCLVDWAQIASDRSRSGGQEWVVMSNRFLQLLNKAQECGSAWLESSDALQSHALHSSASTPEQLRSVFSTPETTPEAATPSSDEDYERQLARALELSTRENYRQGKERWRLKFRFFRVGN